MRSDDVKMRALLISTACLLLVVVAGVWFVLSFRGKLKYDRTREDLKGMVYGVNPFDQNATAFHKDVEATWSIGADEVNGPNSDAVRMAGLTPCVTNLVYTFNYQMPAYQWFSPGQNRRAAVFGVIKSKFFPVSVDKVWHVSQDGHLAMLWCRTNAVYIYRDDVGGMRETLYYRKKDAVEAVQRTGASRFAQRRIQRHRRLAPAADLVVRPRCAHEHPLP
jgi:hypothetical protein